MKKNHLKFLSFACAIIFLLFVTTISAQAQAVPAKMIRNRANISRKDTRPECAHLKVYLHGSYSPTWKCLDKLPHGMSPNIYATDCGYNALYLYGDNWHITLCLIGYGSTNMDQYCFPFNLGGCLGGNWNDQAYTYQVGCSPAYFFADNNEQGTEQYAQPHENHLFDGGITQSHQHALYDHTLSSVRLTSNCQ